MNHETYWAVAGLILVIADLVFGTFFILFVGLGALITALLTWTGLLPDLTWQWIVFAGTSTLGLLLFRKKLVAAFGKGAGVKYQEHIGHVVVVAVDIPENGEGRVNYRGAEWNAITTDKKALPAGSKAIIRNFDGIVLEVEAN
ncbi:MAG: NfeD family protein [Bacteroidetes bacterium]|nr:NfeD family protein [Bacteroidota bacterium]